MKIYITNPGRRMEVRDVPETGLRGPAAVLTDERDQEILGYGAALTDSACVLINALDEARRDALLEEVYSPDKDNFSVTRLCVGASDYAEQVYDFAPVADDMTMEHFDASHDDKTIIPVVKKAREYNPDLYLYSSPWSPPGWMKTSYQMQGGWMRDKYVDAYALYYLKFLQHYLKAGIRINALTPQNETETDQVSRMPACYWHPDIEMHFAKAMRKLLDQNEFEDVKIWLMDHNFIMWHRVAYEFDDEETKAAAAGVAWHPYEGDVESVTVFRKQHPECENHWTEGDNIPFLMNPSGTANAPGVAMNKDRYAMYGQAFIEAMNNGIQSITLWNLALDQEGYPNVGPFRCRGSVEISRDLKSIKFAQDYDTLRHFSRFVKRGARRIVMDTSAVPAHFHLCAFENPDGQKVVIISNTQTFDSALHLTVDGKDIPLWILRESINTVVL